MDIVKRPDFAHIYTVDVFEKELTKLFGKSDKERKAYLCELHDSLTVLDNANTPPTTGLFEHIPYKGVDLYRIKSKSKRKNVRVLYFWQSADYILLLSAFEEKQKGDYKTHLSVAYSRYKQLDQEGDAVHVE